MKGRVLLADGEGSVRRSTQSLLTNTGLAVDAVADQNAAAWALANNTYDLLIADTHIGGNTELELLAEPQLRESSVPVILTTGNPSMASAVRALRLAAVDYLVKPLRRDDLLRATERGINKGRALRSVQEAREAAVAWTRWAESIRERSVLHSLLAGRSPQATAMLLGISTRTVKFHQTNLLAKLDAESRTDLLRFIF